MKILVIKHLKTDYTVNKRWLEVEFKKPVEKLIKHDENVSI